MVVPCSIFKSNAFCEVFPDPGNLNLGKVNSDMFVSTLYLLQPNGDKHYSVLVFLSQLGAPEGH